MTTVLIRSADLPTKYGVCAPNATAGIWPTEERLRSARPSVFLPPSLSVSRALSLPCGPSISAVRPAGESNRRISAARNVGKIKFIDLNPGQKCRRPRTVVMNRRGGEFAIVGKNGRERERCPVIYGAHIVVAEGQSVSPGDLLATWDPFTTPIITEVNGGR
jgi:hypothetical protein